MTEQGIRPFCTIYLIGKILLKGSSLGGSSFNRAVPKAILLTYISWWWYQLLLWNVLYSSFHLFIWRIFTNSHGIRHYFRCLEYMQECASKCLLMAGVGNRLMGSTCGFLWYKYSCDSWFQISNRCHWMRSWEKYRINSCELWELTLVHHCTLQWTKYMRGVPSQS